MTRILRAGAAFMLALVLVIPTAADAALLPEPTGSCPKGPSGEELTCSSGMCGDTKVPCNYSVLDIQNTIVSVGNWIIGIIGLVVLLLFMYGGFLWVIAAGNQHRIDQGLNIMIGAGIGLLIVFSAGSVLRYFLVQLNVDQEVIDQIPIGGSSTDPTGGDKTPTKKEFVCGCTYGGLGKDMQVNGGKVFPLSSGTTVNAANCTTAVKEHIAKTPTALGLPSDEQVAELMKQVSCKATEK